MFNSLTAEQPADSLGLRNFLRKKLLEQEQRKPKLRVYASEIEDCERKIVYSLRGYVGEPVAEPEWALTAATGTAIHRILQELIAHYPNTNVSIEHRVESDAVSGYADAVIETATDTYIVDIKTVSNDEFRRRSKLEKYKAQIGIYGALLMATKGIVLLVNRDNGALDVIEFDIDYQRASHNIERAGKLVQIAKAGGYGNAEWLGSYYCERFCPYRNDCYELENYQQEEQQ